MLLPPQEDFSPLAAGAISIVVNRLARFTPGCAVLGRAPNGPGFPGITFVPTASRHAGRAFHKLGAIRQIRALRPAWAEIHQDPRLARLLARLFPRLNVTLVLHNDPLTMRGLKSVSERRTTLRLARVVTVSEHLARLYATGLDVRPAGLQAIPNPVEPPDRVAAPESRRSEFLFVGRVTPDKGVDLFIEACRRVLPDLPGWSARVIGGDRFGPNSPETPFLRDMRGKAVGAGLTWAGYQPHEIVLAGMASAAIVVVPSRWAEPFGLTALEALAHGAALIATNTGGLPEVVRDGGVLLPPADLDALATAMLRLARDEAARRDLVRAGLARAAELTPARIVGTWERLRTAPTSDMPALQPG